MEKDVLRTQNDVLKLAAFCNHLLQLGKMPMKRNIKQKKLFHPLPRIRALMNFNNMITAMGGSSAQQYSDINN